MRGLEGKYAIVTGGGKGIGYEIAKRFCEENLAGIAILDYDYDLVKSTALELDPSGKKVIAVKCDISDRDMVKNAVDEVISAFGKVDILINNAGITMDRMFHKMEDASWDRVLSVNLTGTYNMCKQVFPLMREQKSGAVVNMASAVAYGNIGQANYAASKAGLLGFTKTLAKEGGKFGIRANAVLPAYIATDMYKTVPDDIRERGIQNYVFLKRMGKPEEVASAVAFLASDESSYITGQDLILSGGVPSLL